MMNRSDSHTQLDNFAAAYNYDVDYLRRILEGSEAAFSAYSAVRGMSSLRETLPIEAHFVARITTMLAEDCGACAQLNLAMALENGVSREMLQALIEIPESLPAILCDVRAHTLTVVSSGEPDVERWQRLVDAFGESGIAEIAVCIAGARVYPTLKRAMGAAPYCKRLTLDQA